MKPDTKKWDRIRIFANLEDYRPVLWPPLGPYWCSGFNDKHSVVVAYVPHGTSLKEVQRYWPEVREVDTMQERIDLEFSSRFPKPEWYKDEA